MRRFFKAILHAPIGLAKLIFSGLKMLVYGAASLLLGLATVLVPLSIVIAIIFAILYYLSTALDGLW